MTLHLLIIVNSEFRAKVVARQASCSTTSNLKLW